MGNVGNEVIKVLGVMEERIELNSDENSKKELEEIAKIKEYIIKNVEEKNDEVE